jgi:hypothetical protein
MRVIAGVSTKYGVEEEKFRKIMRIFEFLTCPDKNWGTAAKLGAIQKKVSKTLSRQTRRCWI